MVPKLHQTEDSHGGLYIFLVLVNADRLADQTSKLSSFRSGLLSGDQFGFEKF
jgi:hypothetical protein